MMRSKGISALCIVLGLLTVAGFGDSIVLFSGQIELIPSWLGYLTFIFGITAGGAAFGLWRMKRWGLHFLRAWFVACFILLFAVAYVFNLATTGGVASVAIITLVLAGLFLVLDRHVASKIQRAT